MVSSASVTGAKNTLTTQTDYFNRIAKMELSTPTVVGFVSVMPKPIKHNCSF